MTVKIIDRKQVSHLSSVVFAFGASCTQLIASLCMAAITTSTSAQEVVAQKINCNKAVATPELKYCSQLSYQAADKRLNEVYKRVTSSTSRDKYSFPPNKLGLNSAIITVILKPTVLVVERGMKFSETDVLKD
jgi:hypothetical protein